MKYKLKYSPDASDRLREIKKQISASYRFLHVEQNYAFYRIENDTVYVTDIYNEQEDFMWRMFRVNRRT